MRLKSLGLTIETAEVRADNFEKALLELRHTRPGAILVLADPILLGHAEQIVAFISEQQMIAIYSHRDFVLVGGLLSYRTNYHELFRRGCRLRSNKILGGTKPGDLPVQRADRFELLINLRTAKTLGLDIPDKLIALPTR